jgi:streptogramin lyase
MKWTSTPSISVVNCGSAFSLASIVRAAFAAAVAVTVAGAVAATGSAPASAASLPTLTISAGRAIASPHGGTITFQATLSAASKEAVSVHYATVDRTAVAGTDYDAASGTLKIPAGSTSGSVTVTLLPVAFGAGGSNKTFALKLSNVSGATLPKSSAVGIIHPDVYVTGSQSAFADVVINPSGTTVYLTVPAKNQVAVLDLKTGVYGKPIAVGSDPQGIDITPNGATLYVCDAGGQTISRVVIATRKVTTIITPSSFTHDTPLSIAVLNKGHAIYTVATGNVVPNSLSAFIYSSSLDGDGSTMLVDGAYVINGASGAVLGTINDACSSSALNGTGSTGYCLEAQALAKLNVGRSLVSKRVHLPQPAAGGKQLAYSSKGHVLVAETGGGQPSSKPDPPDPYSPGVVSIHGLSASVGDMRTAPPAAAWCAGRRRPPGRCRRAAGARGRSCCCVVIRRRAGRPGPP